MRLVSRFVLLLSLIAFLPAAFTQQPSSAVPSFITYSGTLKNVRGPAYSSRIVGMTFAIYNQQDSGAPLWLETQNVGVDSNGHYTVSLGSMSADGLPTDLFSSEQERWLGIKAEGQAELPRVLLVSVPYALRAREAETLGGLPASAFVKSDSANLTGTKSGSETQNIAGTSAPREQQGVWLGPMAQGHGTTGYLPVWQNQLYLGNSTIFQDKAGQIGIGTNAPKATLDVNTGGINAASYQLNGKDTLINHARLTFTTADGNGYAQAAIPWAQAFSDTTYTVTCSPEPTAQDDLWYFVIIQRKTDSAVIEYANYQSQTLTVHCLGVHD